MPAVKAALPSLALAAALVAAALGTRAQTGELQMSPISGDPEAPRRHFRLSNPAELSPLKAAEIYTIVRPALKVGYALSGHPAAERYQDWHRLNVAPYLSATHGNHYLNNYVNDIGAGAYARFEDAGSMPVGTIVAKDSFTMTRSGEIVLGALFLMEKMPPGYSAFSGDWKYSLIQADGTLFGETSPSGPSRVDYCVACHGVVSQQDHLWFLPKPYRAVRDRK